MNLDKFLGCVYGATIGDRIGVPVETMTACEIHSKFGEIRGFTPGSKPSDDSQLLFAMMDAFIESGGKFSMPHIVEMHKEAYRNEWHGWGRSTRQACKRLCTGAHWTESGEENGAGNGVMMKIPALGLWNSLATEDIATFLDRCVELARMTHLGTPAIVGGAIHTVAITTLAARTHPFVHAHTFLSYLYAVAGGLEAKLPTWKDKISQEIINIANLIHYGRRGDLREKTPGDIAYLFGGGTSYAPCSLGLSYVIFAKTVLCNPDNPNPFDAVFEAVNAGGDTDTNASIVGSLVGALYGMKAIPQDLIDALPDKEEIRKRTEKFFEACERRVGL